LTLYDLTNVINEPNKDGALLDPVIVSNIDIVVDSEVIGVGRSISDHNATMINIKIPYSIKKTYMRKVWQYKHADLLKLNNEMKHQDFNGKRISKNALILISCHQALRRNTLR
jgi:hypothetical protein